MDDVVVYNELVAITAGAGLLGFAAFLATIIGGKRIDSEGWAAFFGVTGGLLVTTGLHTTMTWPFGGTGFEYANIAFGQPAAGFGALLLLAAVYLWRHRALFAGDPERAGEAVLAALKPAAIFVGALGLGMAALAVTFVRFQLGAAPPEEPISGRFGHLPIVEALFLGGLWGIVAIGALLFAIARQIPTLPNQLWQSLTWDQGAEMAQHVQLRTDVGLAIYFCDPSSPWQRGTNENTNGLLRQYFPKGTDLARYHRNDLEAVAATLNARPRKTLGWKTPAEALTAHLDSAA